MKNSLIPSLVFSVMALGLSNVAQAVNINFEDVAVPSGTFNPAGKTVTSQGFTFTSPLNNGAAADELILSNNSPFAGDGANGTTVLGIRDSFTNNLGNNIVKLTASGNQLFSLTSLDISEFGETVDYARTVTVLGTINGGGTVTKNITLDGIVDGPNPPGTLNDFQTATFDNTWTNLLNVTFLGFGSPGNPLFGDTSGLDAFQLDNIIATVNTQPPQPPTTTPEPSSLLGLILFGGLGITLMCRQKLN